MDYNFAPAIARGSTKFFLPQPVGTCRIDDSFDSDDRKVPRSRGELCRGRSMNGPVITIEGEIGAVNFGNSPLTSEMQMFENYLSMRDRLDDGSYGEFDLYVYHPRTNGTLYYLKRCVTRSIAIDIGDKSRHTFPYRIEIKAQDPLFYKVVT